MPSTSPAWDEAVGSRRRRQLDGGAFDLVDKVKQGGMYEGFIRQNFGQEDPERGRKPRRWNTSPTASRR